MRERFVGPAAVLLVTFIAVVSTAHAQEQQQFRVTTARGAVIRAQPTTSSERMGVVPTGTILKVVDATADWVKVLYTPPGGNERAGYVSRTLGFVEKFATPDPTPAPAPKIDTPAVEPASPQVPPAATPPTVSPVPADQPVAPTPKAAQRSEPGQFGLGLQLGINPGGVVPSILYDLKNRPVSIRGLFDFGTGYSAFGAQALYRFSNLSDSASSAAIVPYVGGGLVLLNVDYGSPLGGSQTFTGFLGSGGVFFTFKSLPSVRFSAEVNVPIYSYGTFGQPVLYGAFLGLGGHYFFPSSR